MATDEHAAAERESADGGVDGSPGSRPGGGDVAGLRAQLAVSEARFRSIIERNADGIVIVDAAGRTRFVNPAAERLFGRSAAELLDAAFGFAVVAGETAEVDVVRPAGGEPVVAELRASATTWEGEPAELVTLRDITDRKQAEERAQRLVREQAAREQAEQASRRARFLAEAAATLDSSLDADITLRSLARLIVPRLADWCVIDVVEGDVIRRVSAVHSDADRQTLLDELRRKYPPRHDGRQPASRVIETGEPEMHCGLDAERLRALALDDAHARLLGALGVRSYMAVPLQLRDRRLGAITLVCGERDFTDAELSLAAEIGISAARALDNARLYEAALAASHAKSDFLAVMSHELRTPLNAVLGYTQLLLGDVYGELQGAQRTQLERVRTSAQHLLQIIEEILMFASMEAGRAAVEPADVPLGVLIDEVVSMMEPLARQRGLEFVAQVAQPDAVLFTDALKVRQILLNLLTNAVKFTPAGTVTLSAILRDERLVLEVSDTGPGIEHDRMHHIFEPFQQLERPLTRYEGGTGLGLSLTKRLATLLRGSITVQSEVGAGSTFTVQLPARAPGG